MGCYFIVNIYIGDAGQRGPYDEYVEKVRPIVERYGGQYLVRTEELTAFSGKWNPDRIIIIRFPDRKHLDDCFSSEEYVRIEGLRSRTVESRIIIAEGA